MFPIEIWLMIFMELDFYAIQRFFTVSKKFYKIKNSDFWEKYYNKRFGYAKCGEFGYYPMVMSKVSKRWELALKICDLIAYDGGISNGGIGCHHPECKFSNNVHKAIQTQDVIIFGGFVRDYVTVSSHFRNTGYNPFKKEFNDIDIFINENEWEETLEHVHDKLQNNDIMITVKEMGTIKYDWKSIKCVARDITTNTKIELDISVGVYFLEKPDFDVNSLYLKIFDYPNKPIIGTSLRNRDVGKIIINCQKNKASIEFEKKDLVNLVGNNNKDDKDKNKKDKIKKRIEKMINKGFVFY